MSDRYLDSIQYFYSQAAETQIIAIKSGNSKIESEMQNRLNFYELRMAEMGL